MSTHTPLLLVFLLMGCVSTTAENKPLTIESNFSAAMQEMSKDLPLTIEGDFFSSTYEAYCSQPKLKNATIWYERRDGQCVPVVNKYSQKTLI